MTRLGQVWGSGMSAYAVREFIGAFALSAVGLGAALVILWGWEVRALHRALTLPAVNR